MTMGCILGNTNHVDLYIIPVEKMVLMFLVCGIVIITDDDGRFDVVYISYGPPDDEHDSLHIPLLLLLN